MKNTYTIAGREYPVIGYVNAPQTGRVPLVDMPMMSDEEWERTARENAVHNFTMKFGRSPETVEEAVEWQREDTAQALRRMGWETAV